ncbi:MAG: hypothetical protein ABSH20_09190, partial [Tepidisphaeraceae bacterium]
AKLGLAADKRYVAFDYWKNELVGPFEGKLVRAVAGRSCVALAVRAVQDRPMVISTSRHITQGMVDLFDEKWDAAKRELSGVSRIVGGDAYELRIVGGEWKAMSVDVSGGDAKAGEIVALPGLIRVKIESGKSGEVKWRARFTNAK